LSDRKGNQPVEAQ